MKFALIALAILAPSLASADSISGIESIEKGWKECHEKEENQSTQGMIGCNMTYYDAADAILNARYKDITKQLKKDGDTETQKRLVAAQRAWIAFRDSECQLQGTSMLGGTGENVIITGCLTGKVIERVKDLDQLFNPGM